MKLSSYIMGEIHLEQNMPDSSRPRPTPRIAERAKRAGEQSYSQYFADAVAAADAGAGAQSPRSGGGGATQQQQQQQGGFLPEGTWEKRHDPDSGFDYWLNSLTGDSRWDDPWAQQQQSTSPSSQSSLPELMTAKQKSPRR